MKRSLPIVLLALAVPVLALLPLPDFWIAQLNYIGLYALVSLGLVLLTGVGGLSSFGQAAFVGIRSLFYRVSMIAGQGGLVYLAGHLAETTGQVVLAWQVVLGLLGLTFLLLFAWHRWVLPRPAEDRPAAPGAALWPAFVETFTSFFRRRDIALVLAFLLLFRLGEAQLVKLLAPFLLDPRAQGGLGLSTAQLGIAYGTFGVAALTLGGLLGGLTISRFGLKRCLWPMVAAIHTPNLLYVALALWQPDSLALVTAAVAAEQLGYGFGFAAYLMFMIHVAEGQHKTAHYALCTGFMALGMMLPGMVSGWLQQQMGYTTFFVWVCVATLPSVVVAAMLKIPPEFGRKQEEAQAGAADNPQPTVAPTPAAASSHKP